MVAILEEKSNDCFSTHGRAAKAFSTLGGQLTAQVTPLMEIRTVCVWDAELAEDSGADASSGWAQAPQARRGTAAQSRWVRMQLG